MVLSGLALAFSRLIDDSVVVIENIYRHIELGEDPKVAAVKGANEVALAVLAIMLVAVVVFFPVTLLFGVSKYLFSALALAVVLALCASYFDAVTVVPLFCAYFLKPAHEHGVEGADVKKSWGARFHAGFNAKFEKMLSVYEKYVQKTLDRPREALFIFAGVFLLSFALIPFIGVSFFPRSDAGQFVINVKAPTGTRIEVTNDYVKQVEEIVRQVVKPDDLNTVVSNIGVMADLSALFTPNSGMHTAFVQVGLKEDHHVSSFVYMDEVRRRIAVQLPQLRTYFQSGGLVDAVLNQGKPAPIDVQVSGMDLKTDDRIAQDLARQIRGCARRFRRLHPAGHGLPRARSERESRSRRRTRPQPQGSDRQPHHRAHFGRDDRAQLLGGSKERQQLFRHRAVSGKSGEIHRGSESDAAALAQTENAHVSQSSRGRRADSNSHGSGSLPAAAHH